MEKEKTMVASKNPGSSDNANDEHSEATAADLEGEPIHIAAKSCR